MYVLRNWLNADDTYMCVFRNELFIEIKEKNKKTINNNTKSQLCQLYKRKSIRKTINMFCAVCELSVCETCWVDHQFQEGPQP